MLLLIYESDKISANNVGHLRHEVHEGPCVNKHTIANYAKTVYKPDLEWRICSSLPITRSHRLELSYSLLSGEGSDYHPTFDRWMMQQIAAFTACHRRSLTHLLPKTHSPEGLERAIRSSVIDAHLGHTWRHLILLLADLVRDRKFL